MKILAGHVSPETAYVVNDYPYGFRLRCWIRYWLEHNPKHGTRMWSQTTNPKLSPLTVQHTAESCPGRPCSAECDHVEYRSIWNKPKSSTYAYIAGCMYLDDEGHVQWSALSEYSTAEESRKWLETYREGLTPAALKRTETWVNAKVKYEGKRDALKAQGQDVNDPMVKAYAIAQAKGGEPDGNEPEHV